MNKIDFSKVKDPRKDRKKLHKLHDILVLTLCAVLSGCNDWDEIALYGRHKIEWLKTFLSLPNGIPSHDTINRVFSIIDVNEVNQCLLKWIESVCEKSGGKVINIDGKRLCNSGEGGKKSMMHIVQAWSSENALCLGQIKTAEKSNEITAIPELLKMLIIEGSVITIDAMGCQEAIVKQIIAQKGDYVIAVKQNQKTLYQGLSDSFKYLEKKVKKATTPNGGHGRIEVRTCSILNDFELIDHIDKWEGLKTIVKIDSKRTIKNTMETQEETRYYISSLEVTPERMLAIIRQHWSIENELHWCLDVVFNEDNSTKQAGNAAQNFNMITKLALSLLKRDNTSKSSLKNKRLKCGWSNDYIEQIITNNIQTN